MPDQAVPTEAELRRTRIEGRNWGRWGADDQAGAVNLITAEKRLAALRLPRTGRAVSLSRPYPKIPGPTNPTPAQHFMRISDRGGGAGAALDYYGFVYHGQSMTHLDALCHVWDADGMWQGRDPARELTTDGTRFADVTAWSGGIVTRGVLLDVPRHRGTPYVTADRPVHGSELAEIADAEGVTVGPGDALIVYSGYEAYLEGGNTLAARERPGLHASCAGFIRERDVSLLVWDMMDAYPTEHGIPWPVHGVIFAYGVPLLDNAYLRGLADACAEEGRHEFLLMVLPLVVEGGTGSPVNPVAMF
jgi:kynurenine formamidase